MKNKIRCPKCKSNKIIKKGFRKGRFVDVQKFNCQACGTSFTDKKLENATYPARVILGALNNYSLGMTLEESAKDINKRFKIKTYPVLIGTWIKKFEDICSFIRLRKGELKNFDYKGDVLLKKEFFHKQPYTFYYHKIKAEKFLNEYFSDLRFYLLDIIKTCPDELFNEDNLRCSQLKKFNQDEVFVVRKENYACRVADFALKAINNNYERHEFVENLLLINDTATFAVEIPIWLYPEEVPSELRESGIFSIEKPLTGHIDILQSRFGIIHIMDFKPGAEKVNAISQLFAYSVALGVRTGIWLHNFRCAWFDNKDYFEFSPSEIVLGEWEKKGLLEDGKIDSGVLRKYCLDEKARQYYTSERFQMKRGLGFDKKEATK